MKTPPLLIGAAILFWGLAIHQLVLASLMAVAVEASRLIKHRWDFGEADFKRISALCSLALISIALYRLMTGWFNHPAWMIFKWLPIVLLPLFLAQACSTAERFPLNALFLFRRKQPLTDQRKPRYIDLSNGYLISCIFAAGFANNRNELFYAGLIGFAVWTLWYYRRKGSSLMVWMALMVAGAGAGYLGQMGLAGLQTVVEQKTTDWFSNPSEGPYRNFTQIGEIHDEKLSNRIVFRARTGGMDERSLLLREATYDTFRSNLSLWSASRKDFNRLSPTPPNTSWHLATGSVNPRTCTIAQYAKGENTLLKLPNGVFQIDGLDVSRAEKNDFGALKVTGDGLMTYHMRYGSGAPLIAPPGTHDLKIPKRESKVIERLADQLNLHLLPPAEILKNVKFFFETQFTYALKQKSRQKNTTAILNFLTHTRSGHCEFFATATVLLLRQAGIPARYAKGYAVDPTDSMDGWSLVRTRYAHAWAVAFVDNTWVNVDTTPATWQEMEREQDPYWYKYWQKTKDLFSGFIFRFTRWHQNMQGKGYMQYFPLLLIPLFLWVGWRILARFSKKRLIKKTKAKNEEKGVVATGSDSAFYPVEQHLVGLGLERHPWETLSAWLNRIESTAGRTLSLEIPRKLLAFHYRYRFDPRGLSVSEKSQMTAMSAAWLAKTIRTK